MLFTFNFNLETLLFIIQFIGCKHTHSCWTLPLHFHYYSIMLYSVHTYINYIGFSVLHYICQLFNLGSLISDIQPHTFSSSHFDLQFLCITLTTCGIMQHPRHIKNLINFFIKPLCTNYACDLEGLCIGRKIVDNNRPPQLLTTR